MIWTSRFLFLDPATTMGLDFSGWLLSRSTETARFTRTNQMLNKDSRGRLIGGDTHAHLLEAEVFFNRQDRSIQDFEKIFVGVRNPYGLEFARYLELLDGRHEDHCPAWNIAVNGSFVEFLKYAPRHGALPPRLDRYVEVLGKVPENLVVLRYESLAQDLRLHLSPYLTDADIELDLPDDRAFIGNVYDAESEGLCYNRHRWLFDRGYYPRMVAESPPSTGVVGSGTVAATAQSSAASTFGPGEGLLDPKVSIVMVCGANSRFLGSALNSVLRQSFTDWELLLVDVGPDHNGWLMDRLAACDPRVRRVRAGDAGRQDMAASLNLAYREARGELIARLQPDDVYACDTAIAEQVAIMDANPQVAMVYSPSELWASWYADADVRELPAYADEIVEMPRLIEHLVSSRRDEPHSGMERRSAVEAVGGCDASLPLANADFSLLLKLAARFPIFVATRCWYRLRVHPGSQGNSMAGSSRSIEESEALYRWTDAYLKNEKKLGYFSRNRFRLRWWWLRSSANIVWRHEIGIWYQANRAKLRYAISGNVTWAWLRVRVAAGKVWRQLSRAPSGSLGALPKVITLKPGEPGQAPAGIAELVWKASGTDRVQIRIGGPDGSKVFLGQPAQGRKATGPWVEDRAWFFLQDANAANPKALSATLDVVQVRVRVAS